jgi:uncharacterized coiled-coil protein SlyX
MFLGRFGAELLWHERLSAAESRVAELEKANAKQANQIEQQATALKAKQQELERAVTQILV